MNDNDMIQAARDMQMPEIRKRIWELGKERISEISETALAACYSRPICAELGIDYCDVRKNDVMRAMVWVALAKGYI